MSIIEDAEAIYSIGEWPSNAELIEDVANLYLKKSWVTLDPTYGLGTWWKRWRPDNLVACDIVKAKSPLGRSVDFTKLPWDEPTFDVVAYDPPYKLNGQPDEEVDERYGVDIPERWQDRMALMEAGFVECARVLKPGPVSLEKPGYLIAKCQDQVCSGAIRFQTDLYLRAADKLGLEKIARFDMLGGREQPQMMKHTACNGEGCELCEFRGTIPRVQRNVRSSSSQLLVFKKRARKRKP